jgi:hypothetical protein
VILKVVSDQYLRIRPAHGSAVVPLLSAAFQVVVGGLLVFGTGILIGNS